ncbi:MCP four helix bundle domain-containing protein, partial [Modestobacter roseus]
MTAAATPPRRLAWFTDRPIGVKIGAVIALLIVVIAATSVLSISRMRDMRSVQEEIYTENLKPLNSLAAVQRAVAAYRSRVLQYPVYSVADRPEILSEAQEKLADLQAASDEYSPYVVDQEAVDTFEASFAQLVELNETRMVPAADAGDLATFGLLYKDTAAQIISDFSQAMEDEGLAQAEVAATRNAAAAADVDSAVRTLVVSALVGVLVAGGLAYLVVRRVLTTVRSVQTSMEAMAAGDLTRTPQVRDLDEIGRMAASLAAAQESLRSVLA